MERLTHDDFLFFLVQLCMMLIIGRGCGELFKRLKQPAIAGEIIGGILLGPSVFQALMPDSYQIVFLDHPHSSLAMDGIFSVALVMMLFISGMEIKLQEIWKNGRAAITISITGMLIPLGAGIVAGWLMFPYIDVPVKDPVAFSLFMGTALSITALPVIAKILLDIEMLNTRTGSLIVACAILNDFAGWLLFSIVLSMIPGITHSAIHHTIWTTLIMTLLYALFTLTVFRFLINRLFRWLNSRVSGPGGSITIAMAMCFVGAVATEYIGIHAVFGAFLMGIAFGSSVSFSARSKDTIHQFIINIFAPLFFVSIGLKVDFIHHFDAGLALLIIAIAFVTKISGGIIGGKLGGLSMRESVTVGFGINARGAMEIILGLIALENGLINQDIFVALTIMAILTSLSSGFFMRRFMREQPV